jgi:hypothetical protein
VIIFPSGDYEYNVSPGDVPTVGDTIRRKGVLWSVAGITRGTITTLHVERVETPAAKPVHVAGHEE